MTRSAIEGTGRPRIALLAPMPAELRPLVTRLGLMRTREAGEVLFRGWCGHVELVAVRTGVGMAAAAVCARRVLDALSPDRLVVVGIAGGIGASVAIGDLVRPERVVNLDTGETFTPFPFGEGRECGSLASSDRLLSEPSEAHALAERGFVAIDMETAAIAGVCEARGCAWSVVRAISDRADDGSTDASVLGLLRPDGSPDPAAALRFVLRQPWRIPLLVRLARGSQRAADAAAAAVVAALVASPGAPGAE